MPKNGDNRLFGSLTDEIARTYYEALYKGNHKWEDAIDVTRGRHRCCADKVRKMLIKNRKAIIEWLKS